MCFTQKGCFGGPVLTTDVHTLSFLLMRHLNKQCRLNYCSPLQNITKLSYWKCREKGNFKCFTVTLSPSLCNWEMYSVILYSCVFLRSSLGICYFPLLEKGCWNRETLDWPSIADLVFLNPYLQCSTFTAWIILLTIWKIIKNSLEKLPFFSPTPAENVSQHLYAVHLIKKLRFFFLVTLSKWSPSVYNQKSH